MKLCLGCERFCLRDTQAGVPPVVVVVDEGGDLLSRLLERLELAAPDEQLLELAKP